MTRTRPESDVEQLFAPLFLVIGIGLIVFGGDLLFQLFGLAFLAMSAFFFWIWHDIHKHPEKWRSAL